MITHWIATLKTDRSTLLPPRSAFSTRYVKNGGAVPRGAQPLGLDNCVQVTISSYFLGMKPLVSEALRFIAKNLTSVVKLDADLQNLQVHYGAVAYCRLLILQEPTAFPCSC